jgi:hypothetical protein
MSGKIPEPNRDIYLHVCCKNCQLSVLCKWKNFVDQASFDVKDHFSGLNEDVPIQCAFTCKYFKEDYI